MHRYEVSGWQTLNVIWTRTLLGCDIRYYLSNNDFSLYFYIIRIVKTLMGSSTVL